MKPQMDTNLRRCALLSVLIFLALLVLSTPLFGEDYGSRLGVRRGGVVGFSPQGVSVRFDALDPAVRKWYVPQELFPEYQWRQWNYTNYARDPYEPYMETEPGYPIYDLYGNAVPRGWLIYDWRQEQPKLFGSSIFWSGLLERLLIATDSKGKYHYSITIGSRIRTVLTPMTFSKPDFTGAKWDLLSDKYGATLLLSRISSPFGGFFLTPLEMAFFTNLVGGRVTSRLGDFVTLGATYVNSHQSNTLTEAIFGNPLKGRLTTRQNRDIHQIIIILSDDSPEDGEGGAAFFSENAIITDRDGNRMEGRDVGLLPVIEGGFQRTGFLAADGNESIRLKYDFTHPSYAGPELYRIKCVSFELALANDYKVEITSDRQINAQNIPVFLTVARARGNVKDRTNRRLVRFDYGLPTANEIFGFTVDVTDVGGFSLQGELDFNRRYRQYPNINLKDHNTFTLNADAWYVNISYRKYPWLLFGEMFSMDHGYTTTGFMVDAGGGIDYEDRILYSYEFVDDNDDLDRYPDWRRSPNKEPDRAVFPGWDENNDFISDFNQNDNPTRPNFLPDYEEPFLRYSVDRPEYLFGIDLNNNGWIDRFENDDEPDYLYRKDHRGYNFYTGVDIVPEVRMAIGQLRERLLSQDRHNLVTYGLFTLDRDYGSSGRLGIFESLKKVKDNIPDDLFQWAQPTGSQGYHQHVEDPLSCRNTWVNTTFLGYDYSRTSDFNLINKIKWEILHQRDSDDILEGRSARRRSGFLGIINKIDYTHKMGDLWVHPRWKSEYLLETPFLRTAPKRHELRETVSFILGMGYSRWHRGRVLRRMGLETGVELTFFNQLREPTPPGLEDDFFGAVWLTQLTTYTDFLGYRLITQAGFRFDRQDFEDEPTRTTGTTFVTVFAGIQE